MLVKVLGGKFSIKEIKIKTRDIHFTKLKQIKTSTLSFNFSFLDKLRVNITKELINFNNGYSSEKTRR